MAVSQVLSEHVVEALSPLGRIVVRRMFGGAGVYCDGVMFGLVSDDTLYLKADGKTNAAFIAEGCGPFVFASKRGSVSTSYWQLPDRLLDEPEEMLAWARIALGVARQAKRSAR